MAVNPVTGKCYLDPTDARTGGTLVRGVVDDVPDALTFFVPANVLVLRSGLGPLDGPTSHLMRWPDVLLLLPMKDDQVEAMELLYAHLTTDGLHFNPDTMKPGSKMPSFEMIVRPTSESRLHIYSPNWRTATAPEQQGVYSQALNQIEGNFLPLIANGAPATGKRPWMWDTAAAIDAHYELGGV